MNNPESDWPVDKGDLAMLTTVELMKALRSSGVLPAENLKTVLLTVLEHCPAAGRAKVRANLRAQFPDLLGGEGS